MKKYVCICTSIWNLQYYTFQETVFWNFLKIIGKFCFSGDKMKIDITDMRSWKDWKCACTNTINFNFYFCVHFWVDVATRFYILKKICLLFSQNIYPMIQVIFLISHSYKKYTFSNRSTRYHVPHWRPPSPKYFRKWNIP